MLAVGEDGGAMVVEGSGRDGAPHVMAAITASSPVRSSARSLGGQGPSLLLQKGNQSVLPLLCKFLLSFFSRIRAQHIIVLR